MKLYLDSNVFIYTLAGQEPYFHEARALLLLIEEGNNDTSAVSSALIFGEVIGAGNKESSLFKIQDFIDNLTGLSTIPVTRNIAIKAGSLRREVGSSLRLPDAIHLATAIEQKATFVTADEKLFKIAQKYVDVRHLRDFKHTG